MKFRSITRICFLSLLVGSHFPSWFIVHVCFLIYLNLFKTSILFCLFLPVSLFILLHLGIPFPKNYLTNVKKIMTRLFRVFVHVYIHHFDKLVGIGAVSVDWFSFILICLVIGMSQAFRSRAWNCTNLQLYNLLYVFDCSGHLWLWMKAVKIQLHFIKWLNYCS